METTSGEFRATLRDLAHSLDCITEEDLKTLTGWTYSTMESYRKRGTGPTYTRSGKYYLYPRSGIAAFMAKNTRERKSYAKDLL